MVNEERTKLMTKAEIFRSREERRALRINRYDRFDYVTFYMILCAISFLIACVIALAFLVGLNAETLLAQDSAVLFWLAIFAVILCALLLIVFMLIAYRVYRNRHIRSEKKVKYYQAVLKQIHHLSEKETQKVWRESEEYRE